MYWITLQTARVKLKSLSIPLASSGLLGSQALSAAGAWSLPSRPLRFSEMEVLGPHRLYARWGRW